MNYNTGWSKSLCAPDDYNTESRCTETIWSPCSICSYTNYSADHFDITYTVI